MKQFTQNDISAASMALMTFLGTLDGKIRKSRTLVPVVEKALEQGLTFDELFNRENWFRAAAAMKGLGPEDYVNMLASRETSCRSLKDEEGWCDDMATMTLVSKCFHDFYMAICPKGGTWSTENARLNLEYAIKMHSLQALMSEKAIKAAAEAAGDESGITCFSYIQGIIKCRYEVEDELSEEQHARQARNEEMVILEAAAEDEGMPGLVTEPAPDDDDDAIYDPDALTDMDMWPGGFDDLQGPEDTFISFIHPREMKKTALQSIIYNYKIEELSELFKMIPDVTTLADFIEKLTDGEVNTAGGSMKSREIHQFLNGDLLPTFINCIKMQGYEMTEEMAVKHDPLLESWDFRDEKTRKTHKLKQLIYNFGEEDQDLLDCIQDIEKFFSKENQ